MSASKQWGSDSKKLKDDSTDVWLPPKHSTEKASPDEQIEHLRIMFESVEDMLNSPDYDDELKDELSETCPKYMDVFLTSKRDLLRNDCGIVVTGETSAGKSTLINQLVGNKVCTTGNCATTGKITRIRNSEKMEIKCYTKDDILKKQEEVKDVNKIKSIIRKLTDINKNPNDKQDIYYVDVNLPVPILKGNVIIVDTPGIGENERLDKILLDFLPHAVSFVFVVNARNAGGIHENRFSKILKSIIDNREKMPCFDPRQVLILTSQWDIVDNNDSSSDEDDNSSDDISSDENEISSDKDDMGKSEKENQHTKTWNKIIENLESSWGWFDVENVFRVSLKQVKKKLKTSFTDEYNRFETVLKANIDINKNKRVEYYYRFLQNFIRNAERGALTRLNMLKKSEEEQQQIINENNDKIHDFLSQCKQKSFELEKYKTHIVSMLAEKLYYYLHSINGREEILNPQNTKKIGVVSYLLLIDEVPSRFENGIKRWCIGQEVKTIIEDADAKLRSYSEALELEVREIESDMTEAYASDSNHPDVAMIVLEIILLPWKIVTSILTVVVFLPIIWAGSVVVGSRMLADTLYDECLKQISLSGLKKFFENSFGVEYSKAIVRVFDESLPNDINSLLTLNKRLLVRNNDIKQKEESLMRLKENILKIRTATEQFERNY